MNDTSTSPIIMGLLFVLRCLIPLGVLFGISYLLRRLELVIDHAEDAEAEKIGDAGETAEAGEAQQETPPVVAPPDPPKEISSPKPKSGKKQKGKGKKSAAPKKKES